MIQKIFVLAATIGLLIISSCSKEKVTVNLSGNWELRVAYNGLGGSTNYPAGNGYISRFTFDTYEVDSVGKIISSGTYKIIPDKSYITGKTENRIIYDNNTNDIRTFIQLSNDTLSFFIDAYDAGSSSYVKQ